MEGKLKCLLKCRVRGYWITSRGRKMTVGELLRSQLIDPTSIKRADGVSDLQMGEMAGNAMSQNVLEKTHLECP